MKAYWFREGVFNFGDLIGPYLIARLTGRTPDWATAGEPDDPLYVTAGSVLGSTEIEMENAVVWGAGFMAAGDRMQAKPRRIAAVRGPLSAEMVRAQGIECPKVYGDPGLLLPLLYRPEVERVPHRIGIVTHYADEGAPWIERAAKEENVIVISAARPKHGGVDGLIRSMKSCSCILSSSLHGLVVADAYGIPARWIEITDRVAGDGFKFKDYFASVGRPDDAPIRATGGVTPASVAPTARPAHRPPLEVIEKLLAACPFVGRIER